MKIYAPVKDANGIWASVRFVNGVGETDNPRLIKWFKEHGYKVPIETTIPIPDASEALETALENCDEIEETPIEKCGEPDFDAMNPNELREWAKANGLGGVIKNIRNKEKLLEIVRGE
jgi:hypothetical protein